MSALLVTHVLNLMSSGFQQEAPAAQRPPSAPSIGSLSCCTEALPSSCRVLSLHMDHIPTGAETQTCHILGQQTHFVPGESQESVRIPRNRWDLCPGWKLDYKKAQRSQATCSLSARQLRAKLSSPKLKAQSGFDVVKILTTESITCNYPARIYSVRLLNR